MINFFILIFHFYLHFLSCRELNGNPEIMIRKCALPKWKRRWVLAFYQVDLQPNENSTQYWTDLKRHWHLHQISDSSDEKCRSDVDEFWWQVWIYGASILMHKRKSSVKPFLIKLNWMCSHYENSWSNLLPEWKLFNMYSKRTKNLSYGTETCKIHTHLG